MKPLVTGLLLLGLVLSALAVNRSDLDYRIRKLAIKLEALQAKPDKRIPAQNFRNAKGIILLDRTKAGFVFAYQGGSGIAMAKDPKTGQWSPPAFLKANEASLGFQVGGQQSFVVILLMNTNAMRKLAEGGSFSFGGEASGTAGSSSARTEGTISSTEPLMLVYSDTGGLYGGVAVKGGALSPDTDANVAYYGQYLTTAEILFDRKVKTSEAATEVARKFDQFSK
jgi:lipid-binding SYLF domain-containing protein